MFRAVAHEPVRLLAILAGRTTLPLRANLTRSVFLYHINKLVDLSRIFWYDFYNSVIDSCEV